MAWPTVTNTFAAGTRAIASKVNQNFTDLKNAIGGTYDLASANYTILDTDGYRYILVTTGSSDRTVTLPTVADNEDRVITIVKIDSGAGQVIVDGEGAETIDGEANYTISDQYGSVTVKSNGSAWYKIYGGAAGTGGASGRNYLEDWFDASKNIGTVTNGLGNNLDTSDRTGDKTTWGSSDTSLLTIARSTSSPLRQTYSYLITEAGSSSGAFIESPLFSLDAVDLGKPVTVSFDCADNAVSDDYQVYICRYDNNDVLKERIPIAGTASATSPYSARIPTGTTKFQGFFIAGSTSTDQYALRIVSNSNSAASIKIDSLYVGPEKVVQGAGISDWVIFTPTINNDGSNSTRTNAARWRRVGDSMELQLYLPWTGAGAAATLSMVLPNSLTADSSKFSTANSTVGVTDWFDNGVGIKTGGTHLASTTTISFSLDGGTADMQGSVFASGDVLRATAIVPIVGWSSNVTMADRAVEEYAYNSTTTATDDTGTSNLANGAGGVVFQNFTPSSGNYISKRVRFNGSASPTDRYILEVSDEDAVQWVEPGCQLATYTINPYAYNGIEHVGMGVRVNTDSYGNTDVVVIFGRYRAGSSGSYVDWSAVATAGFRWRVRKVSGGAAVGYPISARNIVGDTTGTTVPAGYIGEIKEVTGTATPTTGSFSVSAALTLDAGVWDIRLMVVSINNAASTTSGLLASISSGSSTATAENINAYSYAQFGKDVSSTIGGSGFIEIPVSIASTTNYYAKFLAYGANYSSALSYRFYARRIA